MSATSAEMLGIFRVVENTWAQLVIDGLATVIQVPSAESRRGSSVQTLDHLDQLGITRLLGCLLGLSVDLLKA